MDREKEAPLTLVVIDREEKTSEFLQEVKQDKQSNLPGEDWRDAVVVVWTLVLTVAAEKDDVGRR
jgi:PII-like signaling protein